MNQQGKPASIWLQSKYETWRYQNGIRKTLTEFAALLVSQKRSCWAFLDDSEQPNGSNLAKLGSVLGFEIYELLGIKTSLILDSLPPQVRVRFASAFTDYYEIVCAKSIDRDSIEARSVLNEMVKKYHLPEIFISTDWSGVEKV